MSSPLENEHEDYVEVGRRIRETGRLRFPEAGYDKIVAANGCFDVLHRGHLQLLAHARDLAGARGAVVVCINSDESVRRLKGPNRPILDEETRALILIHLRLVDHVVVFGEDTPLELFMGLYPDIIVKGGDYDPKKVVGHEFALVSICPTLDGWSTSKIEEKIRG